MLASCEPGHDRADAAKQYDSRRVSITTAIVISVDDITKQSVITIPTSILITSALLLAACSTKAEPNSKSGEFDRPQIAHERGLANGKAMVANAERCEAALEDRIAPCKRACELNHSNSCANWGLRLMASDPSEAADLLRLACRGGSGVGCEGAARLSDDLVEAAKLYLQARRYHRVHCDQGYGRSCSQLATLYREGLGGDIDRDVAALFQQRAQALK